MRISERQFGVARVLDFQGPLVGVEASTRARDALQPKPDAGCGLVVVNLTRVADVDCDGMLTLGQAERAIRRAGGTLRIALPDDGRRPLMNRCIRAFFDAFESVEDALADLRGAMAGRRKSRLASLWPGAALAAIGRRLGRPQRH